MGNQDSSKVAKRSEIFKAVDKIPRVEQGLPESAAPRQQGAEGYPHVHIMVGWPKQGKGQKQGARPATRAVTKLKEHPHSGPRAESTFPAEAASFCPMGLLPLKGRESLTDTHWEEHETTGPTLEHSLSLGSEEEHSHLKADTVVMQTVCELSIFSKRSLKTGIAGGTGGGTRATHELLSICPLSLR